MEAMAVLFVMAPPPGTGPDQIRPFAKVDNREIFMRTIELYANRDQVSQRILCVLPDDMSRVQEKYGPHLGFQGVSVTTGGPDWFGAVQRGLEKLKPPAQWVMIHDASRPAVPYGLLDALEQAAAKTGAAVPVLPLETDLVQLKPDRQIEAWATTGQLFHVQYPQLFRKDLLVAAYARRAARAGAGADDAALVQASGAAIATVPGWRLNLRIDSDEMVRIAGDLLKHLPRPRRAAVISPFEEAQW